MKKPRNLSPEERELWDKVARTAERLEQTRRELPSSPVEKQKPKERPTPSIQRFRIGQKIDHTADHDLLPSLSEQISSGGVVMDKKAFGRMRQGKLKPEARIDLHGMTLAQAHPALNSFIYSSHSAGRRLVLVITGKGKPRDDGNPIPTRLGVLRHQVPQWLRMPPLAPLVLQVAEAHLKHGGHGAYYVYLRRAR